MCTNMHGICMEYAKITLYAKICNYMQIYANICKEYAINMQIYA